MTQKSRVFSVLSLLVGMFMLIGLVTWFNRVSNLAKTGTVTKINAKLQPVQVEQIMPLDLVERMEVSGILMADKDVMVIAEVAGRVTKVYKQLGDSCAKNEVLLALDAERYQIAAAQAKAMFRQAEVELAFAQNELKRVKNLKSHKVVTGKDLDAAQRGVDSLAAALEQARAAKDNAEWQLRHTKVKCPFEGLVAQKMIHQGQMVSMQTPLFRLVDASKLRLELNLAAAQLFKIKVGKQVKIYDPDQKEKVYSATVHRLGVAADPLTRTFQVEIKVDEQAFGQGLKPGQVVQAVLDLENHQQAISVPLSAVAYQSDTKLVWVVADNKAQARPVELGPAIEGRVLIKVGLKQGEQVVVVGAELLSDGAEVQVVNQEKPKTQVGRNL
jgi:RND family efflux transporter MFP subunit